MKPPKSRLSATDIAATQPAGERGDWRYYADANEDRDFWFVILCEPVQWFSAFGDEEIKIFLVILVANLQRALVGGKVDDAALTLMRITIFELRFSIYQFENLVHLARRKSWFFRRFWFLILRRHSSRFFPAYFLTI